MPHHLIIVAGLPATGKTTLATSLADYLQAPVFHKDAFKELTFDQLPSNDPNWSRSLGQTAFRLLDLAADAVLTARSTVILEANYNRKWDSERLARLAHDHQAEIVQIWCSCQDDIRQKRFIERHLDRHAVHQLAGRYPDPSEVDQPLDLPGTLIKIDTTHWATLNLPAFHQSVAAALS